MGRTVLITGGAGFIGSHVADELLTAGDQVLVLDSLDSQVHGEQSDFPAHLSREVEFLRGDVRDRDVVEQAVRRADAVIHLAAAVGVGQSMYEIAHYTAVNDLGTAVLLESISRQPVERLVVASSMSIYGEGLYRTPDGELVSPPPRPREQLEAGQWEHRPPKPPGSNTHPLADDRLEPVPTPEFTIPAASSVYALSKYVQERMSLIVGEAYRVPTVALRFFNVYGPRQALSNPYTGVLAIFSARYLQGQPPLIFEDGEQLRDFVNVHDVARACRLSLDAEGAAGEVFNIGSGEPITVRDVALRIGQVLNCEHIEPQVVGKYRVGDIRHCFADITKARKGLGYAPQVSFDMGMTELAEWLVMQQEVDSRVEQAQDELRQRGLVV